MFVVGPVLSPVVGALVLQVSDWRMTFCALGARRRASAARSPLLFEETLPAGGALPRHRARAASEQLGAGGQEQGLLRRSWPSSGLYNLPFMAYIAVGSYVYITFFGLTELEYSVLLRRARRCSPPPGRFIWLQGLPAT